MRRSETVRLASDDRSSEMCGDADTALPPEVGVRGKEDEPGR